ncbi:MAG: WHG domain-containing protein [Bacteroidales bacterium]|jgi:AcrR family transcriptional regulator|nr:WHG domain-containing protein [Bacteroidales bacterium]MCI2122327.1 WHG domain-containing protein [Bacteroidales bacterium]MCI2145746.1 WHG domain-containing protein [Bacteroidales bacterium]
MNDISRIKVNAEAVEQQAIAITEESGFMSLSIKRVAEALRIKSPSLYNHIKSLSDLQKIVIERVLNDLKEELVEAAIGRSGTEALERMALAYLHYALKHPNLYECILFIPSVYKESLSAKSEQFLSVVYKVVDPVIKDEDLRILFVRGYRSLLHGFASLEVAGYFKTKINPDKSFEYLVRNYVNDFFEREINK